MPDAFFHSDKKRKRTNRPGPSSRGGSSRGRGRGGASKPSRRQERDEDVSSESDAGGGDLDLMDFREGREDVPLDDEDIVDQNETAAEKRVRLAKGYLAKVKDDLRAAQEEGDYDAAEIDRELIASRLQKDVAETQGRIHTYLASKIASVASRAISVSSQTPTEVAITPTSLFISTKRGVIHRYGLPSLRKVGTPFGQARVSGPKANVSDEGHKGEILCIAATENGKFLVSGGRDRVVGVWNVEGDEAKWLTGMRGHKDAISSISIPPLDNPSHHILTASLSRHLALASLSTLATIDTFFGHQDSITSVSSLKPTLALTAGSRDRTCRWWKVEEEVQLVFRGGGRTYEGLKGLAPEPRKERLGGGWEDERADDKKKRDEVEALHQRSGRKGKGREFVEGSIDCVCMLDDQHFVSGGDSGSISLWHTGKKKPIFTMPFAHGVDDLATEHELRGARWITSLAALRGTDLFASGSWDGSIRLWAIDPNMRSFAPASTHEIAVAGVINSIQILAVSEDSIDSSTWRAPSAIEGLDAPDSRAAVQNKGQQIVLAAAVAQEPRLGRWMKLEEKVKSGAFIAHIQLEQGVSL